MQVILNNLRSAHNVGSIFRTSDGAGVSKIYLCGYTPAPLKKNNTPRIQLTKVSLGAERFVEWEKIEENTVSLINRIKKEGKNIIAVEQDSSSIPYKKIKLNKEQWDNTVLVMGNEVNGLTPDIIKTADHVVEIPMYGKKTSLNVSVSFGIIVYSLKKE